MRPFPVNSHGGAAGIQPAALHAQESPLVAEGHDTAASIFFSLVAHRMNINYSFLVGMREIIQPGPDISVSSAS